MRRVVSVLGVLALGLAADHAAAGLYIEEGVAASDAAIVGWATGVSSLVRGPKDIANPAGGLASFGAAADALGTATGSSLVSLGDGGSITVTFDAPITNGPGADFAVFENGFAFGDLVFAELGYVEVSSNGSDFARFPSASLTQTATQVGSFGGIDPTDIYNLAGKHAGGLGTPFDLSDLLSLASVSGGVVDVTSIAHVRIVDVVGRITPTAGYVPSVDSLGNVINDPYATNFASSGFDLDAVGVINSVVPDPTGLAVVMLAGLGLRRRVAR